jgi:hypothetical protein
MQALYSASCFLRSSASFARASASLLRRVWAAVTCAFAFSVCSCVVLTSASAAACALAFSASSSALARASRAALSWACLTRASSFWSISALAACAHVRTRRRKIRTWWQWRARACTHRSVAQGLGAHPLDLLGGGQLVHAALGLGNFLLALLHG